MWVFLGVNKLNPHLGVHKELVERKIKLVLWSCHLSYLPLVRCHFLGNYSILLRFSAFSEPCFGADCGGGFSTFPPASYTWVSSTITQWLSTLDCYNQPLTGLPSLFARSSSPASIFSGFRYLFYFSFWYTSSPLSHVFVISLPFFSFK